VPSHRSYFDFVLLSWLFYQNHLMPPHIAARENMAFGPFGFVFRRAGAFFLRRSFDDELYRAVFRGYVGYLVREGFTQEFFIEGSRSRTGKTLAPRMGMLSWIIEGFIDSRRRDLLFVPVGITYERLVEEGAMVDELEGGTKREESMLGLMRRGASPAALRSVYVNFGAPLPPRRSAIGARSSGRGEGPARRAFVELLGLQIVEQMNSWSCRTPRAWLRALLGERRRGLFRDLAAMQQLVDLLRIMNVKPPRAPRDEGDLRLTRRCCAWTSARRRRRGEIPFFEPPAPRARHLPQ
jgi:glycerol-3-phosphate O-acyltransferase